MLLFPQWNLPQWKQVDDSVRGGASHSKLAPLAPIARGGSDAGVMFSGVLDTKTLGGAGFASQKYRFNEPLNLDSARYSGLRFKLVSCDFNYDSKSSSSSSASASSSTRYSPPNEFTITLTTVPLPHQKPKSRVTWESHFEVPQKTGEGDSWAQVQTFKLDLPFESFSPVYRGKPVPNARSQPPQVGDDGQSMQYLLEEDSEDERPVFHTEHIYEFGLMCRSEFGKQEGQFCLGLIKVEAIERSGAMMSWMRRMSSSNSASG